jgi:hypothetical protein
MRKGKRKIKGFVFVGELDRKEVTPSFHPSSTYIVMAYKLRQEPSK